MHHLIFNSDPASCLSAKCVHIDTALKTLHNNNCIQLQDTSGHM